MVYDRAEGRRMPVGVCPLFTSEDEGFVPVRRLLGIPYPSVAQLLALYEWIGSDEAFRRMVVLDALPRSSNLIT